MNPVEQHTTLRSRSPRLAVVAVASVCLLSSFVAGCRPGDEPGAHVAGWTLIDPGQRHPILVSHQPVDMSVRVARGSTGLTPEQRAHVADFVSHFRLRDTGGSRLAIGVPSGAANEVAVQHVVADLRGFLRDLGVDESRTSIQVFPAGGERQPPVRLSYAQFVAEGPQCGQWPANLADDPRNLPFHNLGCSTQRNIAAQVANASDLLGPRTMSPHPAERREASWDKWTKGESTTAKKNADERIDKK